MLQKAFGKGLQFKITPQMVLSPYQINAEDKGDQFDLNNLRNLKVLVMEINSSMETIPDCLCSDKVVLLYNNNNNNNNNNK